MPTLDYSTFPPIKHFEKVLHHAPHSAITYATMWNFKEKRGTRSVVSKKKVKNIFLISSTIFRNQLLGLAKLGLLAFEEKTDSFLITIWNDNED